MAAGQTLTFQTRRSRLYCAASRAGLGEIEGARRIVAEALAANPELTADYIRQTEQYCDPAVPRLLVERLIVGGLPHRASSVQA